MKKILDEWQALRREYGWKSIIDAFSGGILFAALIFLPVFLALAEAISIHMFLKELWFSLIVLALIGFVYAADHMGAQALNLKKPNHTSDIRLVMRAHFLIHAGFLFLAGIVFVLIILPLIWV